MTHRITGDAVGEHKVAENVDQDRLRAFTRALLDDASALEKMLESGLFEAGERRIGAEQEMFLVDPGCQPKPAAMEVLKTLGSDAFTTELARFNLECNLPAYTFKGTCLSQMERELDSQLALARKAAAQHDADVVLTGILPTLQLGDLTLDNMCPVPRYFELNAAMRRVRGDEFKVRIKGTDELDVARNNVMLESCNTSFQVHFQVSAEEFPRLYNTAQAVTGPVMAAAVNSPILLGKRLWQESRVALFQHSVDDRSDTKRNRGRQSRVHFGRSWIDNSVLEIFREDIARFRVLIAGAIDEDPLKVLAEGRVPQLSALRLHNGTVYRWNRPCYGITNGKPHLRIENRVLPAGPTVLDEMANAAFYFGLMTAVGEAYGDVSQVMDFADVRANFIASARLGLNAQLQWMGRTTSASDLILNELLPLARQGLKDRGIDPKDTDRYLDVIHQRVETQQTGAQWAVSSFNAMPGTVTMSEKLRAITSATMRNQWAKKPVHTWARAQANDAKDWRHSFKTIGQFMTADLFTVHPDDLVDLAANLMEWKHIRHIPVEDDDGKLVGMLTHSSLLKLVGRGQPGSAVAVREIMSKPKATGTAETPTLEAIATMRKLRVGCLPVLDGDSLVGLVTEQDLFEVAARLLEQQLREFGTS